MSSGIRLTFVMLLTGWCMTLFLSRLVLNYKHPFFVHFPCLILFSFVNACLVPCGSLCISLGAMWVIVYLASTFRLLLGRLGVFSIHLLSFWLLDFFQYFAMTLLCCISSLYYSSPL